MLEKLKDFINTAQKNRKYASNTASGLRAALKLFEPQLNDQEREDVNVLKSNIEKIAGEVFAVNKSQFTANTINEYKRRVIKLLSDYESYGIDASKMASWNPATRNRIPGSKSTKKKGNLGKEDNVTREVEQDIPNLSSMNRMEITLRPGVKAIFMTPSDLNKEDYPKIKAYLDMLKVVLGVEDKNN